MSTNGSISRKMVKQVAAVRDKKISLKKMHLKVKSLVKAANTEGNVRKFKISRMSLKKMLLL